MIGFVKHIRADKGFGFLRSDDGPYDTFFHAVSLVNARFEDLQVGDRMAWDTETDPSRAKPRAVNLRLIEG